MLRLTPVMLLLYITSLHTHNGMCSLLHSELQFSTFSSTACIEYRKCFILVAQRRTVNVVCCPDSENAASIDNRET
jgi:hypothetical protein